MADFDLTQSGQEIQNILDGAAMQTDLTAETERAEQAEQQLQGNIDAEELRAKAAEEANADDIDVIEGKIPAAASSENKLADKAFVSSSIATATATYRGAYNLVSDLHLTTDATEQQIAAALAGAISTADNNDYCFVQIPTADATPTQIAAIERYKFNGTAWAYEYTLNNSGFTADQWAALNSGITTGLVAKLAALPTNDELTLLLGGKQDVLTFDNVPTEGSNNPVKSGGVKSAIDSEKERAQGAEQANAGNIAQVVAMIPAAASSENQLADKNFVNSSIATNTATYRGAYNEVSDLSLTVDATHEQIAAALAGAISTADNNDYCFVQVPTADATPTQIAAIERYKFNGTAWTYEYTLNNSGFTADQWAAINSGITSGLVAKLAALPTNDELTLLLAGKQPMLTFDNVPTESSTNPVKSGGVYAAIAEEAGTRAAAIAAIVALIPSAASALNQLADKAFVNSSISTATAVFKGTFNVVADLELNYNASQAQIALMLGSKIASADNNDYCFVQIPTSNETPLEIARTDRYKYNGTAWAYEYTLNNSGFTAAQWAAINSGITSLLKDKLIDLPTATELATQLAAKQNALTFDTTPTEGSTNPVTSDGIHAAIDTEKARAEAAEADRYTKSETYNKTEINGLVSTPHQNYVTVPTYASLPSSGQSTDTIYRVSSYDGVNSQVDNTVYSEYAWDGTQYVFLDVKSQIEEVFDITEYNSGTKYADLSAALGVDGANIPATLRRGGMSIKYVQTYDNNYKQFRLITNYFNTTISNWQGEDAEPIAGSRNLVESGGVFKNENNITSALPQNSSYVYVVIGNIASNGYEQDNIAGRLKTDYIPISGSVTLTTNLVGDVRYRYYDENKNFLGPSYSSSAAYLRLCIENSDMDLYDKYITVSGVTYQVNKYQAVPPLKRVEDIEKTYLFGGYIKANSSPTITPTSGRIKIYYIALEAGTYSNFPSFVSQETPKAPIYCAAGDVIRCVYENGELKGYITLENASKLTDYFFAGIINSQANFLDKKNYYIAKRGLYGTEYFPDGTLVYSYTDTSGNRIIHRNDNRVIIDSMLIESFNAVLGQFKEDIYDNKKLGSGGFVDDTDYYVTPYIPIDNVQHLIWEVSDNAAVYCEAYDSNKVRTNRWLASSGTIVRTIGGNYSYIRATFKKNGIGGLWFDGVLGWSNTNIDVINAILSAKHLADGYIYGGCVTPSGSPLQDANNIFYLAATEGTYTNFGNITVGNTELAVIKQNGNTFTKESVLNYSVDAEEIAAAVADWLNAHPEATTTIEDGAVTPSKLSPSYFHIASPEDYDKANTMIGALSSGAKYVRDSILGCNLAIGYCNMSNNSGVKNLAIGNQNMMNCTGDANAGIGYHSGFRLTSGMRNLGVGLESNDDLQTGDDNVAVGGWTLKRNNIGSRNIAIGVSALHGNYGDNTYMDEHDWSDNIAIGYNAGSQILTGASKNILIGNGTTIKNDGENQIVIGHNAAATKDNQVVIGNSSHTEFVLGTKKLIFNNDNTVTWATIS